MYGRTTTLAVVPILLCLLAYPLRGNPGFVVHSSCTVLYPVLNPAGFSEGQREQPSPYVLVKGRVSTKDEQMLPGGYFHLDVYKSGVGGKKLLARTGRYQGDTYEVYLSRGFDHTLIFKVENFPYFELQISAEETSVPDKQINRDIVLPAAVAEKPIASQTKAEAPSEVKETALLPTRASTTKTIAVVQTATELPVKKAVITLPPEEPKQNMATDGPRIYAAYNSMIPLYEDFGGTGEVLEEITDRQLMKVLEQTTSQWWMVAYKSEIGWVNAQQIR